MPQNIDEFYFFATHINEQTITLHKQEIHHITNVLRMTENTRIWITNGNGKIAQATISNITKNNIEFVDIEIFKHPFTNHYLHIALAPTKNISRYEWFLEKATEIGVHEITPIFTTHSERLKVRIERLEKIIISAMKQSKKVWKPQLNEPINFNKFITSGIGGEKYIAHIDKNTTHLLKTLQKKQSHTILVGPEGGFTSKEYSSAQQNGFIPVSLGKNRLRAETAGIVVATIVNIFYES